MIIPNEIFSMVRQVAIVGYGSTKFSREETPEPES